MLNTLREHHPFRFVIALGCLAPIIVTIVIIIGLFIWSSAELAGIRSNAADRGEPLTLEALDNYYTEPPTGQNGAEVYRQATQAINHEPEDVDMELVPIVGVGDYPYDVGDQWSEEMRQHTSRYLEANAAALDLIHEAIRYDAFRFPLNLTAAPDIGVSHFSGLRSLARHAVLEAVLNVRTGNIDAALAALEALAQIPRALSNEPLLVSQLIQVSLTHMFWGATSDVLSVQQLTHNQLNVLRRIVDRLPDQRMAARRGYIGERAYYLSEPEAGLPGFRLVDQMIYAGRLTKLIRLTEESPRQLVERSLAFGDPSFVPLFDSYLLPTTADVAPAVSKAVPAFIKGHIQKDAMRVAIAIEHFRLDHGSLPDSLDELVPDYLDALPADPYSERPLLYLQQDPGIVVYSVGPNGTDEKGARLGRNHTGDIPFRVAR